VEDKGKFWIIPNYRTSPSLHPYEPLTDDEKFKIATEDSFDRGTAALAVLFAGEAQLTNATPEFGQGVKGYARYLGTSYADDDGSRLSCRVSSGPTLFPARGGERPVPPRKRGWPDLLDSHGLGSRAVQFFGDHRQFDRRGDFDGLHPDNRTATNAISKLGVQLGVDKASNILKEFWPDINRKPSRNHRAGPDDAR
jgi:hypothetical protein